MSSPLKLGFSLLGFGCFMAVLMIATANPYSGANVAMAAIFSAPFILTGTIIAGRHLLRSKKDSFLEGVALVVLAIPCFLVLLALVAIARDIFLAVFSYS